MKYLIWWNVIRMPSIRLTRKRALISPFIRAWNSPVMKPCLIYGGRSAIIHKDLMVVGNVTKRNRGYPWIRLFQFLIWTYLITTLYAGDIASYAPRGFYSVPWQWEKSWQAQDMNVLLLPRIIPFRSIGNGNVLRMHILWRGMRKWKFNWSKKAPVATLLKGPSFHSGKNPS